MYWNYRVIRRRVFSKDVYQVHRVFYSDASKSNMTLIETHPASVIGILPLAMLEDIEMMCEAFHLPTLYVPEWNSGS